MNEHTTVDIAKLAEAFPTAVFKEVPRRGNHLRPRYAFVRTLETDRINRMGRSWDNASYDIVDNGEGSERVLARGVDYRAAIEIVGALNMVEETRRVAELLKLEGDQSLPSQASG